MQVSRPTRALRPVRDDHLIAVAGGGASGLMAALRAARARPGRVLLLEKEARVGRKLMATGNGRCNLMNLRPEAARYHGGGADAALALLRGTPPEALLDAFAALGLRCREEAEGRVYPFSGQAGAVLDVLRMACEQAGVRTRTGTAVSGIARDGDGFRLSLADGEMVCARRVIVAGGGRASPDLGSDGSAHGLLAGLGHAITPLFPAIVPLRLPAQRIRGLKGVRAHVSLALYAGGEVAQCERGEALFTDYGLSGVAAMQLARGAQEAFSHGQAVSVSISLLDEAAAREEMARRAGRLAGLPLETLFVGLLHRRVGECLLREAGLSPQAQVTPEAVAPLAALLADWRLPVQGTMPFAQAQVTAGGADMAEFDPATLESRLVPGLYACGEVLDVDGDCGGYNLMWAWLSGMAAGDAAARDENRSEEVQ